MTSPTILILAGKRDGKLDPLAENAGVSHKCRVPICGKPLLQWVLEGVAPAFPDSPIYISIHDPEVIADIPAVQELTASGRLQISIAQAGILESVEAVAQNLERPYPMMITTGDNVLITPELLREAWDEAQTSQAEAMFVLGEKMRIKAAHPEAQRNFYEFKDIAIANCNLYFLRDAKAMNAAEAFREGGQFMKSKGRILRAFGLTNFLLFASKLKTVDQMMKRMSKRFGVHVHAHVLEDGAYAVDVDNQRTYDIAELLLKERKADDIPESYHAEHA